MSKKTNKKSFLPSVFNKSKKRKTQQNIIKRQQFQIEVLESHYRELVNEKRRHSKHSFNGYLPKYRNLLARIDNKNLENSALQLQLKLIRKAIVEFTKNNNQNENENENEKKKEKGLEKEIKTKNNNNNKENEKENQETFEEMSVEQLEQDIVNEMSSMFENPDLLESFLPNKQESTNPETNPKNGQKESKPTRSLPHFEKRIEEKQQTIEKLELRISELTSQEKLQKIENKLFLKQTKILEKVDQTNKLLNELKLTKETLLSEQSQTQQYFLSLQETVEGKRLLESQESEFKSTTEQVMAFERKIKKVIFDLGNIKDIKKDFIQIKNRLRDYQIKIRIQEKENEDLLRQINGYKELKDFSKINNSETNDLSEIETSQSESESSSSGLVDPETQSNIQLSLQSKTILKKKRMYAKNHSPNSIIRIRQNDRLSHSYDQVVPKFSKPFGNTSQSLLKIHHNTKIDNNNNKLNSHKPINKIAKSNSDGIRNDHPLPDRKVKCHSRNREYIGNTNVQLKRNASNDDIFSVVFKNENNKKNRFNHNNNNQNQENYNDLKKIQYIQKNKHKLKTTFSTMEIPVYEKIEIESLEMLLSIPIAVSYFKEFLTEQLNQENILFFEAVKNLKRNSYSNRQLKNQVKKIYKTFIKPGSAFEINIISQTRKKIIVNIDLKKYDVNMFDIAQQAVFTHMNLNSFKQFTLSFLYKKLIKRLDAKHYYYLNSNKKSQLVHIKKKSNKQYLNQANVFNTMNNHPLQIAEEILTGLYDLLYVYYSSSKKINLKRIGNTIPFQRFVNLTKQLNNTISLDLLNEKEKLCFFLNIYNSLFLHSLIINGIPNNKSKTTKFMKNSIYLISGYGFSLMDIYHGILRANTSLKSATPYFNKEDPRNKFSLKKIYPKMHFCLINFSFGNNLEIFTPNSIGDIFMNKIPQTINSLITIKKNILSIPQIFANFEKDFGGNETILEWISNNSYSILDFKKFQFFTIKFSQTSYLKPHFFLDFTKTLSLKMK
ncbi:hypothetical protein M0813_13495 [Anaeramoeba flamelloides]|uniref:RGS domain-containing protein n=1 Tax=Anaeramoeba flamelloides TaxID=1746091 RepID=A0ABQ8Z8F2_9EUKA|nr:hypothetical protein M0813_13495 [Anaeramoeba flamelloides]